ncbi:MAG: TRAP transporter small permease [Aromatoleum sp.]|nr:TRAP transporter small permease [Aromatoleum sp.]
MPQDVWIARMVKVTSFIAAIALIAMMLTTVADVAMATLFKRPIIGAYDMVETMLVVSVFLGIPATFLRNGNIVVDVVDFFVSKGAVRRLKQLAQILTLVFLLLLFWNMITATLDAYRFGGKKQELGVPLWVLWLPMLLGVLMSAIAVLTSLIGGSQREDGGER